MKANQQMQILQGPDELRIELDASQVFPDDPGQGTPVLVVQMSGKRVYATGTYNCVSDTGVLECAQDSHGEFILSTPKLNWINAQYNIVDKWLTEAVRAAKATV